MDAISAGEISVSSDERCSRCNCSMSAEWPDLAQFKETSKKGSFKDYLKTADLGCSLCRMVVAILSDVREKHWQCISEFRESVCRVMVLRRDDRYLMILHDSEFGPESNDHVMIFQEDGIEAPVLNLEPYKQSLKSPSLAGCIPVAREWLAKCEKSHAECNNEDKSDFEYPLRLIHLADESQRLIIVDSSRSRSVRYVALSHCWGAAQPLRTCSTNIDTHMTDGIPRSDLPATFRDAIQVSRDLGFGYIWIDSICIIQDDEKDWKEQSAQSKDFLNPLPDFLLRGLLNPYDLVASVYSNADLVLAAARASAADEGFLRQNRLVRESSIEIPPKSGIGPSIHVNYRLGPLFYLDYEPFNDPLDCDPLNTGGWARQERLLARRYLSFGNRELSWAVSQSLQVVLWMLAEDDPKTNAACYINCMKSALCECACSDFRPKRFPALENMQKIKSLVSLYTDELKAAAIGDYWRARILTPYSGRLLTKSTDKLVALTAVASRLQSEFGLTYLAGLWKDDLIKELLWRVDLHNANHNPIYQESFYAPTWSWVSVDAPMSWHPFVAGSSLEEPLAQVLEAYTYPSTVNPFGPVSHGEIKLSASVRQVTAEYDDEMGNWTIPVAQISESLRKEGKFAVVHFDTSLRVTIEHDELTQEEHPTAQRLRHGEEEENKQSQVPVIAIPLIIMGHLKGLYQFIYGLILQESVTRIGCFERLGVFRMSCLTINSVEVRMMARQEIILV